MTVSDSKTPAPAGADSSLHVTAFTVLFAISFCHLLNDMMQSLLSALYPDLKTRLELNFAQVGLITMTYQVTASILQPVVGLISDKRPMPYSLPIAMVANLIGLLLLAVSQVYELLLFAAALLGLGSAIFHPESSRVAHMASGGRHGLAQSLFQVGGNFGQALGPLAAAAIVINFGQASIAWFAVIALAAIIILWNVGTWYKHHGIARSKASASRIPGLPRKRVGLAIAVLMILMFSKQVYLASVVSYYTFFLIGRFGVSLQFSQLMLFLFLGAVAAGTIVGGLLGDRFGRRYVIWFSILGTLPFTLALPYADLFWTGVLSVIIGLVLASALPAIIVYAQELMPGRIGMISGLFFGFAFGLSGFGAAALGWLADRTSIETVYVVCSMLPALGLFAALLPDLKTSRKTT
ncbi:MAG: MFS transporter [Alphaproteobacteria bacterium]|nr:MFS transporter [Alphaproteobacteria bacterium]